MEETATKKGARLSLDMTRGPILSLLVRFAAPLMLGYVFQQLYNTVDSIVVGNFVGKEALAAVGSTGSIINAIIGIFAGISSGASVVIAQAYGAGDRKGVHDAVHTAMKFVLYLAVAFTAAGTLLVRPMLRLMDTPDDVIGQASTYLTIYFLGVSGLLVYNMGTGILSAVGDSRHPLYFIIFSAVVNTILDLTFVIVFHMGVAGVAWATIIAELLSALLVLRTLIRSNDVYKLSLGELKISRPILLRILRIGFPTSVQMALTAFSNVFVQSYINYFQSACMAGWAAYGKIDSFLSFTLSAASVAVTTFVGQNIGAGNLPRAKKGMNQAIVLLIGVTAAESAVVMLLAPELVKVFNRDADVVRYGVLFLRLMSVFYPICSVANICAAGLRGAGDATAPMVMLLGSFVVCRQIYLYIIFRTVGTLTAVTLGYPLGWVLAAASTYIYYRVRGLKRAGPTPAPAEDPQ